MNTYDPSDRILYVHLSGPADARSASAGHAAVRSASAGHAAVRSASAGHADVRSVSADSTTTCTTLPSGYANQSPHTRLQRRTAPVRRNPSRLASLTV
jgi:hypothetical protein